MRVQLEMTVEDLWNQFQAALRNYQETTEERKKSFEELKAKDEKSAKEIEMQMRKLQRLSVSAFINARKNMKNLSHKVCKENIVTRNSLMHIYILYVSLLQDNIAALKAKMAANARECEDRNKQLREVNDNK